MPNKKYDLPAMPFYFGDWMKAPEVRALELGDRMIWFEMLGFMWESTERGYLTINNKPIPDDTLARMLGLSVIRLRVGLVAMDNLNIFSRRKDGAIYSRRMVGDETKREKYREFGKKGGNPKLLGLRVGIRQGISLAESEDEDENEDESKGENTKESKDDLYVKNPELLFSSYWRRNAGAVEIKEVSKLINDYGIKFVRYAFHEAMEHSAFSLAYVRKILMNKKEQEAAKLRDEENKKIQSEKMKEAAQDRAKAVTEHKQYIQSLYTRVKVLKNLKANKKDIGIIENKLNNGLHLTVESDIEALEKTIKEK
uniref:Uncharacterized protein n=1 Tax=viral metagenome TaxID=1070528 RepID=A0A6H2A4Q8_9ZZZZ